MIDMIDGYEERRLGPFANYLFEYGIVAQYTMHDTPYLNGMTEKYDDLHFFILFVVT